MTAPNVIAAYMDRQTERNIAARLTEAPQPTKDDAQ